MSLIVNAQANHQAAFLDNDVLRNELFNFYTNLRRAAQPAVGFRRDNMLRTLTGLNKVYQALVPAVQQALKFTKDIAREETQQALDGLTGNIADSAVNLLVLWNRVITGGTSAYVLAPSFTQDVVKLAKRLEHAHLVVVMVNYDVPAWYRGTYAAIETTLRTIRDIAATTWDNFTETASLLYLAAKIAAGFAVGYVTYTLVTNVAGQGVLAGTGSTYKQLRSHVPKRKVAVAELDAGADDE